MAEYDLDHEAAELSRPNECPSHFAFARKCLERGLELGAREREELAQRAYKAELQGGWRFEPTAYVERERHERSLQLLRDVYAQIGNHAPAERRHAVTARVRDAIRDYLAGERNEGQEAQRI